MDTDMKKVLTDITKTQEPIKTINLMPSWECCAEIYLRCIESGESYEARQDARKEILRMGKLLDHFIEQEKLRGTESE